MSAELVITRKNSSKTRKRLILPTRYTCRREKKLKQMRDQFCITGWKEKMFEYSILTGKWNADIEMEE
jgi:hypothetical protein